jgi:hypothetical protein
MTTQPKRTTMRIVQDWDGAVIAAAVTDSGEIVATAVACEMAPGATAYYDEVNVWEATGELIPARMWDACNADRET